MAYVSERRQKIRETKALIEQRKQTREQAAQQTAQQPTQQTTQQPTQQGYVSERRQALRESQVKPVVSTHTTTTQTVTKAQTPSLNFDDLRRMSDKIERQTPTVTSINTPIIKKPNEIERPTTIERPNVVTQLSQQNKQATKPQNLNFDDLRRASEKIEKAEPVKSTNVQTPNILGLGLAVPRNVAIGTGAAKKVGEFARNLITDPLGTLDKLQYSQPVQDYIAGSADITSNLVNTIKAFGGDKIPVLNKALDTIDKEAGKLSSLGGTGFWSQVMRSAPQSVNTVILALASGGASIPAQLGGNATLQAIKNTVTSPTFINTLANSFGSSYKEAINDGQDRITSIKRALIQSVPESLIEQAGGLEAISNKLADKTFGLVGTALTSALEEGLEEILQYPLDALSKKITYAPETPWFSTTETAVINPIQMAEAGAVGGVSGALFGGGTQLISDVKSSLSDIVNGRTVESVNSNQQNSKTKQQQQPQQVTNNLAEQATKRVSATADTQTAQQNQVRTPAKSQEQIFDEAINKQQAIVDDLMYRKFYLEHDVEAELEAEAIKLEQLKTEKEKYLAERRAETERAQRAYDYEQGNIPLEEIMRESEIKSADTPSILSQERTEVRESNITIPETKSIVDENRGVTEGKKEEPKPIKQSKTQATGKTTKAYDNDNNEYKLQYAVVSADDLITSHDTNMRVNPEYPQELQPRDRERAASRLQVDKIAYNVQPELLGENPKISDGAPIIGEDNIVESGNGRVIALKKMYQDTKTNKERYVNWLKENANKFGIDANNLPENPVLVRVRQSDVDRVEFARKANESSVAVMSSSETAKTDANRLTDRILGLFVPSEDGNINTAANRPFITAFIREVVPQNEIGKYITSSGYLSQDGLARVRNAIFNKAYESDTLLTRLAESTDDNIKKVTNTLVNIAPKIVSIKKGIKDGVLHKLDYSKDIADAVEKYINLKETGTQVDEYLNQFTLFDDGISKESKYLLNVIDNYGAGKRGSTKKLTEFFNEVFNNIEALGHPDQLNLMGDLQDINKLDVLMDSYRRFEDNGQESFGPIDESRPQEAGESERIIGQEKGRNGETQYSPEEVKNITGHEDVVPDFGPISEVPPQFKGDTVPELDLKSERGAITIPGKKEQQPPSGYTGYLNKDLEEIHRRNRLTPATIPQKIAGFMREFKANATRTFPLIDPALEENAVFMQEAVRFPKIRRMAMGEAARILRDITLRENMKLNQDDFNIFERVVFMQDLIEDDQMGLALPNGWTSETLEAEWKNIQPYINERVKAALDRRKQHLDAVKDRYIKAFKEIGYDVAGRFTRENYFRHQVLEYMQIKEAAASAGARPDQVVRNRGWSKSREGTSKDINTDYLQAEYEVLFGMINDAQIAEMWKRIYDKYDISKELKERAKKEGKNWRELIPEGYAIHQPFEGNYMYNVTAIPDKIFNDALEQGLTEIGVPIDKVRTALAVGQKRAEYVIPKDYITTMKNYWSEFQSKGIIDKAAKFLMSQWKATVITRIPTRVIKYNIRNLSGDVEAAIRALGGTSATAAKNSFRAAKELYEALRYFKFTPDLLKFRDLGGFDDNIVIQEIAMISRDKTFKELTGKKNRNFFKAWDKFSSDMTQYRENITRYATYLAVKDMLTKSPNGLPKNYGASLPGRIKGLRNIEERAYQMTNDAIGNYSEVTVMGRWLRNNLFPFWSFKERNIVSMFRVIKNAANEITESDGQKIAKGLGLAAKVTGKTAVVLGKTAVKLFGFSVILSLMNMLNPNDKELPEDVRNTPHLTLWKGKDGQIRYFSRLGVMTDILEWIGLDSLPADIKDLKEGKTTVKELAKDKIKAPVNMIYSMLTPYIKTPIEIISGQTRYPDVFSPGAIRDGWEYATETIGLKSEYRYLTGKPVRESYIKSLENALLYRSDPEESAYYKALDLKYQYQQQVLKEKPYRGGFPTERANALYYYKLALKYGDKKAAEKYYNKYAELVEEDLRRTKKKVTNKDIKDAIEKGIETSLRTLSPTYGLSEDELAAFMKWLTPKDREVFEKAMEYYAKVTGITEKKKKK